MLSITLPAPPDKNLPPALAVAVFLLAMRCACGAATFSLNTQADALVTTGAGGTLSADNFGGAGGLAIAAGGWPRGAFQSVLQFDPAGARDAFDAQFGAGQWTLQSVTLQLTAAANNNPGFFNPTAAGQFGISLLGNNSWLEGTGTPATPMTDGISYDSLLGTYIDNANDQPLGIFAFGGGSSGANGYLLDMSPGLVADILAGNQMSLRLFPADNNVSYLFNSRTIASLPNRPALILTAVPEPGSLTFGLMCVVIFGWLRFHRS